MYYVHDVYSKYIIIDLHTSYLCTGDPKNLHIFVRFITSSNILPIFKQRFKYFGHSKNSRLIDWLRAWFRSALSGATDCADPVLPEHALLFRRGDRAWVRCNMSFEPWFIYCRNGHWIGALPTDCTFRSICQVFFSLPVVIVRGNAGECRFWAPKKCRWALLGYTQSNILGERFLERSGTPFVTPHRCWPVVPTYQSPIPGSQSPRRHVVSVLDS